MRRRTAAALLAAALAAAAGCRGKDTGTAAAPPAAVETVAAAPREVVDGVEVVGSLAPRVAAEIKSEIPGRVAEVLVLEWERVAKGAPLARIDTAELEALRRKATAAAEAAAAGTAAARAAAGTAAMALAEARVGLERAERELGRLGELKAAGLATRQSLDEAQSLRDAAAARLGSLDGQRAAAEAQARLAEAQQAAAAEDVRQVEARLAKAVVRAPFDGAVAERLVNVGEVVGEMQKVLFRLVDNRVLDLTVQVPARLSGAVRPGQPISFTADTHPGRAFSGTVKHLNPAVSEADRSVRAVAEVPNPAGDLQGGTFVAGTIETGRRAGVILVPRSALVSWDTAAGRGVLLVVEGGAARRREVATGAARGAEVEIAAGLAAGDQVIARGGFTIGDGDRVSAAPAGR